MFPRIIDRATFDKCQALLKKNKYFAKSNVVREPFLLSSRLYCGYCGTPMVADGGVGHMGVTYKYYACKSTKKGNCAKNREQKDALEKWVVEETIRFMTDPRRLNKMVDDVVAYHAKKTDESETKSIEAKIAHARKQIDDTLNSMIAAESIVTKRLLDRKIAELSGLVEDLELQRTKLEFERGLPITRESIFEDMAEITGGDINDKDFQKYIIDNLVATVYIYDDQDDQSVIYFSVGSRKDTHKVTKGETDEILKEKATAVSSTTVALGGAVVIAFEHLKPYQPPLWYRSALSSHF